MLEPTDAWRPTGNVEIVAGTPPGGGQDRAARALGAALEATSELTISVSNVTGRGGGVAWDRLAARPGDGHLLSICSPTFVTNQIYDPSDLGVDDLTHLALLCTEYIVFVAAPDSPITSGSDLVEAFRVGEQPPVVALATALGNVNHVAVAAVARHAGVEAKTLHVRAFDSARLAVAEVVEGRAALAAVSAASALPEIEDGTVRGLAVSAPRRLSGPLESVPTWKELGVDSVIGTWRSVVAPPDLPIAAVSFWQEAIEQAVGHRSWTDWLTETVSVGTFLAQGATDRFVRDEQAKLGQALAGLGLIDG